MKQQPQIKLSVTLASPDGLRHIDLMIGGGVNLAGLRSAVLRMINIQHPHHAGKPIVAIRYSVKDN